MTPDQARAIAEAHDVYDMLNDDEEVERLRAVSPELLAAYEALIMFADEETQE